MAKKQQIILLHNSTPWTAQTETTLVKGELAIEHGAGAANVKIHTLDNNGELASFATQAYTDAEIKKVSDKVNVDITDKLTALDTAIKNEVTARKDADTALDTAYKAAVKAEEDARKAADEAEKTAREGADSALDAKITANATAIKAISDDYLTSTDKTQITNAYQAAVKAEEDARKAADSALEGQIGAVAEGLADEVKAREDAVAALQLADTNNLKAAKDYTDELANGQVATNKTDIATNLGRIQAIEADYLKEADKEELSDEIAAEKSARETAVSELDAAYKAADKTEKEAREAADNAIKATIGTVAEGETVVEMIGDVADAVSQEVEDRKTAISGVQSQIDALDTLYATDKQLSDAVTELEGQIAAAKKAATKVVEGTDAGENLSIATGTDADGATVYTVNLSDVASAAGLAGAVGRLNTLQGEDTGKSVRTIANEELAAQLLAGPDGAVDNFKTLQELAAWLEQHPEDAAAMNVAIQANADAIATEVERAEAAELALSTRIKTVEDDYLKAADKTELNKAINDEATARDNADKAIKATIGTVESGKTVVGLISEEATARADADSAIQARIDKLGEIYATDAELDKVKSDLEGQIATAAKKATTKVVEGTDAGDNLSITSGTDADGATVYTVNLSDVASADKLAGEETARKNADKAITDSIGTVPTDKTVVGMISEEAATREAADKAITDTIGIVESGKTVVGLISEEAATRKNADNALDARVKAVESAYVKKVVVTRGETTHEYLPVNNVLDLSALVIDGGEY